MINPFDMSYLYLNKPLEQVSNDLDVLFNDHLNKTMQTVGKENKPKKMLLEQLYFAPLMQYNHTNRFS